MATRANRSRPSARGSSRPKQSPRAGSTPPADRPVEYLFGLQFDLNDPSKFSAVSQRYCCAKCGFRNDVGEPDWAALKRLGMPPEQLSWRWDRCPNDGGPDAGLLTSPDRRSQRARTQLNRGGSSVRLCTPMVMSKGPRATVRYHPRLNDFELERELHLEERLTSHGLLPRLSLVPLTGLSSIAAFNIGKVKSHWMRSHGMKESFGPDSWAHRAFRLGPGLLGRPGFLPNELACALDPRLGIRAFDWEQILYVPVHIGHSLEDQLRAHLAVLREVRDYVCRFTSERPLRARSDTVYRDVYIFMRHWTFGWTDAQIVADVFPREPRRTAAAKVRAVVRKVEAAAHEAGVDLPPRLQNLRGTP